MAKELKIELVVDDKGTATIKQFSDSATQHMKTVESAGQSLGSSFVNSWQGMAVAAVAAVGGMAGVTSFIKDVAAAYGEQEAAESKLRFALAAHGITNREVTEIYADYAAQLQAVTTFTDDAILSAMQLLTTMGTSPAMIKPATEAVMSLSYAYGKDLPDAAKLVASAMEGNIGKLGRLIPALQGVEKGALSASQVLEIIQQYTGNVAAKGVETYSGKLKQMDNAWGELKETLGGYVVPALKDVIDYSMKGIHVLQGLFGASDTAWKKKEIELLTKSIERMNQVANGDQSGNAYLDVQKEITDAVARRAKLEAEIKSSQGDQQKILEKAAKDYVKPKSMAEDKDAKAAADKAEQLQKQIAEATRKAQVEIDSYGLEAYEKEMTRIESEKAKWQEMGATKADVAKWYTAEISIAENKMSDEVTKLAQEDFEIYCKYLKERDDKKKKDSDDRVKAERDIYKDVRGYENEHYAASIALIESQSKKYKDMGVNRVAIARWVEQETIKAEVNKGEASDDFVGGWSAGLKEMQLDLTKWGKVGDATFKGTMTSMSSAFENIFEDAYKGDLKSISDYSTVIWDGMRKSFFKAAADMAAQSLLINITAGWTDAGKSTLGIVDKLLGYAGVTSSLYKTVEDMNLGQYVGVKFAHGGLVPGFASGGNSPANDTVPAWLSPGEFVVPRSGVNADTREILEYIRAFGRAPGYADGGYTYDDQGYATYRDISPEGLAQEAAFKRALAYTPAELAAAQAYAATYLSGDSGGFGGFMTNLIQNQIGGAIAATGTTIGGAIDSNIEGAAKILSYVPQAATAVAAPYMGPMLAAAWAAASTYSRQLTESGGANTNPTNAAISAAITAVAAQLGSAPNLSSLSNYEIMKLAGGMLFRSVMGASMDKGAPGGGNSIAESAMNGALTLALAIGSGGGIGSTLNELFGSLTGRRVISARNGWDYINRDNTPVITHEGEGILTKKENAEYRRGKSGGGNTVIFNLYATTADKNTMNEFAEMIYPRLKQLEAWGH